MLVENWMQKFHLLCKYVNCVESSLKYYPKLATVHCCFWTIKDGFSPDFFPLCSAPGNCKIGRSSNEKKLPKCFNKLMAEKSIQGREKIFFSQSESLGSYLLSYFPEVSVFSRVLVCTEYKKIAINS